MKKLTKKEDELVLSALKLRREELLRRVGECLVEAGRGGVRTPGWTAWRLRLDEVDALLADPSLRAYAYAEFIGETP